jgi:hypothetical protein
MKFGVKRCICWDLKSSLLAANHFSWEDACCYFVLNCPNLEFLSEIYLRVAFCARHFQRSNDVIFWALLIIMILNNTINIISKCNALEFACLFKIWYCWLRHVNICINCCQYALYIWTGSPTHHREITCLCSCFLKSLSTLCFSAWLTHISSDVHEWMPVSGLGWSRKEVLKLHPMVSFTCSLYWD